MPKPGFSSITLNQIVYDMWYNFYNRRKENFNITGINSLSALITIILDCTLKQNGTRLTEIIQTELDYNDI